MYLKKTMNNPNLPKRKYKGKENKHVSKLKVLLQVALFFTSCMLSISVANADKYAKLTAFSATVSTALEILSKTKLIKDKNMKMVFKRMILTLKCATIAFFNVYLFDEHDASVELINVLLLVPTLFVYLVIWRMSYFVLVEIFFPCTCFFIMYNCCMTSNVFGAVAALLNSWAFYTKNNFKLGNEVLDHNDMYNLLMCFFFWFCQEAIKFERLIKDVQL